MARIDGRSLLTKKEGEKMAKRDENGVKILDYSGMKQASGNYEVMTNTDDISALLDVGIRAVGGKPAKYPATAEGLQAFREGIIDFFRYIDKKNSELNGIEGASRLVPDIEGMCAFLHISKPTFYVYKERGGEWESVTELATTTIAAVKKQLSFSYKIPPMLAVFDLCNNHSYLNTNQFIIKAENSAERQEEKLLDSLEANALTWDEEKGEYIPEKEGD